MPSFSFKMFFFSYKIYFFVYLQNIYLFLLRNIFNEKQAIKQRLDEYSPSSPTVNLT